MEWPPLFADFSVIGITGDEVWLFSSPEKGFPFDEKGPDIDLGFLHQPPFFQVIQHDITPWVLGQGELLGLVDVHLENPFY